VPCPDKKGYHKVMPGPFGIRSACQLHKQRTRINARPYGSLWIPAEIANETGGSAFRRGGPVITQTNQKIKAHLGHQGTCLDWLYGKLARR